MTRDAQDALGSSPTLPADGLDSATMAAKFSALRGELGAATGERAAPDRYVFGEVFARGGLGQVRRAYDSVLGRTIAVKEMLSPIGGERFFREAQVTARLEHPAVVPVHDYGVHANGQPYYCMKLIDGRSLDAVIAETDALAARLLLLPHIVTVAEAVAFAHSKGLLHRDLKPANVLVGNFGETWVIDWGLTGYLDADSASTRDPAAADSSRARLTQTGEWMGTLPYMAPEQRLGHEIDERADVYGLGAVLYHTLSGQRPYGDVADEVLALHVTEQPPTDLERLARDVPPELLAIVHKAMARVPGDRYPNMRALIDDLRRFLGGRLVDAHRYRLRDVVRRWSRRHRAALGVAGLAFVVLVAIVVYGVLRITAARDAAERSEAEMRAALATRWEESGRFELIDARRPLDAVEPLRRALELAPEREHLWTMLVQAWRPWTALRCDAFAKNFDAVVVHPTEPLVALGSSRSTVVELWDVERCKQRNSVSFDAAVRSLRFSPDGTEMLVTLASAKQVRHDVQTMRELERSPAPSTDDSRGPHPEVLLANCGGPSANTQSARHSTSTGLIVADDAQGDVRVWHGISGACVGTIARRRMKKWRIVEVEDEPRLLTLDGDARLSIWNAHAGEHLERELTLNIEHNGLFDFDLRDDGLLVTLGRTGLLGAWDLAELLSKDTVIHAPIVALRTDGAAALVSDGSTVRAIDPTRGDILRSWDIPGLDDLRWAVDGNVAARRGTRLIDWSAEQDAPPVITEVGHVFTADQLEHEPLRGTSLIVVSGVTIAQAGQSPPRHDLRVYDRSAEQWTMIREGNISQFPAQAALTKNSARALLADGTLLDTASGRIMRRFDDAAVLAPDRWELLSLQKREGLVLYDT